MRLNMFLMRANYDIFNAENGHVRSGVHAKSNRTCMKELQ